MLDADALARSLESVARGRGRCLVVSEEGTGGSASLLLAFALTLQFDSILLLFRGYRYSNRTLRGVGVGRGNRAIFQGAHVGMKLLAGARPGQVRGDFGLRNRYQGVGGAGSGLPVAGEGEVPVLVGHPLGRKLRPLLGNRGEPNPRLGERGAAKLNHAFGRDDRGRRSPASAQEHDRRRRNAITSHAP